MGFPAANQTHHRPWVGAVGIILLATSSLAMFYYQSSVLPGLAGERRISQVLVNIVAYQWGFNANGTETRVNPVTVRVGDNVTFRVTATFDAQTGFEKHGFLILGLMESALEVSKDRELTISFIAEKPGDYTIICTIFCGEGTGGRGHSNMQGRLTVLP